MPGGYIYTSRVDKYQIIEVILVLMLNDGRTQVYLTDTKPDFSRICTMYPVQKKQVRVGAEVQIWGIMGKFMYKY